MANLFDEHGVDLNPFYKEVFKDARAVVEKNGGPKSTKKYFVVNKSGDVIFDEDYVEKWYNAEPLYQHGRESQSVPTTIAKDVVKIIRTPNEKAKFAYCDVQPWGLSALAECYSNVKKYCQMRPDHHAYYVYTIWDRGHFYELEPHALVKSNVTNKVLDITPTVEVIIGLPTLDRVCYVHHSTLQRLIIAAKLQKIQYGFIVVKN
jgi:hypothetical protein